MEKPVVTVQVRELVEFALRRGDLGGERDFVGSSRALEGTRGHQRLQRSRPEGYQKEVPVSYELEAEELILRVQGRIDGVIVTSGGVVLEEIKTVQRGWNAEADPLHWAQTKCYAFIYAHDHGINRLALQLTYLELESGEVTQFEEEAGFAELESFFDEAAVIYLDWVRERHQWQKKRDESIKVLDFPFANYRPGQRDLAVAAYRVLAKGGRVFIEAPTGIGKTMGVIYPALKALAEAKIEQVFYLTARTMGRTVAEKAFAELKEGGLRARTLTLTAREKICLQEGGTCDPGVCPYARGYYDRSKAAMRAALEREGITRPVLEEVAKAHQVCPFELGLDVSCWVDAVICDYNYLFDPKVYLRRHFEKPGDYAFLVDEAHNLVDRGREMFSAELNSGEIQEVRRAIKESLPRCARALNKVSSGMRKLCGGDERVDPGETKERAGELQLFGAQGPTAKEGSTHSGRPKQEQRAEIIREFPKEFGTLVETALEETETWLARNEPAEFREALLELYFVMHSFVRTAGLYDERYVTIVEPGRSVRLRLFCLDPSFLLREAVERGKAAVFYSATLSPLDYYRTLLGGTEEDNVLQMPSPFPPENLGVLVHDRVRTQFKSRQESLGQVVEAIGKMVQARTGNYLVYFPSYEYLEMVRERFQSAFPQLQILSQRPGMTESEREDFLNAFASAPESSLLGFAVLGGVFGESIDLVGEKLIGAIIVGVGLPQLCVERDLIRDYFQTKNGTGFDYAYTFPGMNRVLQAIGRVIRSERDRGLVLLLDTRYAETRYRRLFPSWWQARRTGNAERIKETIGRFWQAVEGDSSEVT